MDECPFYNINTIQSLKSFMISHYPSVFKHLNSYTIYKNLHTEASTRIPCSHCSSHSALTVLWFLECPTLFCVQDFPLCPANWNILPLPIPQSVLPHLWSLSLNVSSCDEASQSLCLRTSLSCTCSLGTVCLIPVTALTSDLQEGSSGAFDDYCWCGRHHHQLFFGWGSQTVL